VFNKAFCYLRMNAPHRHANTEHHLCTVTGPTGIRTPTTRREKEDAMSSQYLSTMPAPGAGRTAMLGRISRRVASGSGRHDRPGSPHRRRWAADGGRRRSQPDDGGHGDRMKPDHDRR
jgi:hypothetical protein